MNFEVGDWVTGRTGRGELVHGYIEALQPLQGSVVVRVIQSDREAAVGRGVPVRNAAVRKLPDYTAEDENGLNELIELALQTRDETWFRELTGKLAALKDRSSRSAETIEIPQAIRNRLGSRLPH
ncbi:hypothetical protein [Cohnella zeiphila]|uniref:IDEAL domain-containing protein n=1 Tax=Cohnella zeiphila TaxID=2761120 RepID=A0A7X0VZG2_9BACL|nr:hypothetical protein [Cohnella zeiphila]MBB6735996.1 hypothetical protein [Cohnella zeiphila]